MAWLARTSSLTWLLVVGLVCCVCIMAITAPEPSQWYVLVISAFCAGILVALIWRRGDVSMPLVIALALVFRLAFVWMPPVLSDDAYRYVWDGYVQTQGINPYRYAPEAAELSSFHDEPIFDELNSQSYYSVYPPVSQLIFRIGGHFYELGWDVSYYVIKGILAALEFGAVLVLAKLVGPSMLLLYAWNPLVLIAGAGQAHGESALVFFLSLTLWAARQGRGGRAGFWLAGASLVKLYPFVLFPFLWRRFGLRSVAAGLGGVVVLTAPYFDVSAAANMLDSLSLYFRLFEFNAGFYYLVKEILQILTGADWSKQIGPAFGVAFFAFLGVLYVLDRRRDWRLGRCFSVVVGTFFVLSTTVHPWYLLGILVVTLPSPRPAWHWHWLSVLSIGTYLLYVDGPYWIWVVLGWTGWLFLAGFRYRQTALDALMRRRAAGKADLLAPFLSSRDAVLDLGAGEGFVGEELVRRFDVRAELADVINLNRTLLPLHVYDGRRLPHGNGAFDVVVVVYVLHHASEPRLVLHEARRVAKRRVIVLESTYTKAWERPILRLLDRLVNYVRSRGRMTNDIHIRTARGWLAFFEDMGIRVIARRELRGFIHHRALYILEAAS